MSFCKSDQESMPVVVFLTRNGSGMFCRPKFGYIGALDTRLISRLHRANKGIPPTHPDKDPKLQLGSRPPTKKPSMPAVQQDTPTSGGTSADTTNTGGTLPDGNKDGGALFLTVDAPCSYQEAMGQVNMDEWVEAITEE